MIPNCDPQNLQTTSDTYGNMSLAGRLLHEGPPGMPLFYSLLFWRDLQDDQRYMQLPKL